MMQLPPAAFNPPHNCRLSADAKGPMRAIAQLWCRLPGNPAVGIHETHRISGGFKFN